MEGESPFHCCQLLPTAPEGRQGPGWLCLLYSTVAPHPTDKVPRMPERGREGVRPLSALDVEEEQGQAIVHILSLL